MFTKSRPLAHYYNVVVGAAYWTFAVWLLRRFSPVHFDTGGASSAFTWGSRRLTATNSEYFGHRGVQLQFAYPYFIAAAIVMLLGWVLVILAVRRIKPRRSRLFLASFCLSLFLLLLGAGISDLGGEIHLWNGPLFWPAPLLLLSVGISMSLFTGILIFFRPGGRSRDSLAG